MAGICGLDIIAKHKCVELEVVLVSGFSYKERVGRLEDRVERLAAVVQLSVRLWCAGEVGSA